MEIKNIVDDAKKEGVCRQGLKRLMTSKTKEELLDYFIEGLDFCLEHDFPSKDYLLKEGGGLLPKYGIHIDEKCTLINRKLIVLLGKCDTSVANSSYSVSDLFVKHKSKVKVFASDNSFLRIDCFDSSEVSISASGNAKIIVNVYGSARVAYEKKEKAQIKIINKGKETY